MKFTRNAPIPARHYGPTGPFRDEVQADFAFEYELAKAEAERLQKLFFKGIIPKVIPAKWRDLHFDLDVPVLQVLLDDRLYETGEEYLWLIKHQGPAKCSITVEKALREGWLKIVKWLVSRGRELPTHAVDVAAKHGNLEMVQWLVKRRKRR